MIDHARTADYRATLARLTDAELVTHGHTPKAFDPQVNAAAEWIREMRRRGLAVDPDKASDVVGTTPRPDDIAYARGRMTDASERPESVPRIRPDGSATFTTPEWDAKWYWPVGTRVTVGTRGGVVVKRNSVTAWVRFDDARTDAKVSVLALTRS